MSAADLIQDLIAAGVRADLIARVAQELINTAKPAAPPIETPEERKRRISRETSSRHRASRNVTGASPEVERAVTPERHQVSPSDAKTSPLARVEDNLLNLEVTGTEVVVGVVSAKACHADDWPADPAAALCLAIRSARLDLHKSPGLVTSAGQLLAWRSAGAGWTDVVVPVVGALARKTGDPIGTWAYFDRAIGRAIADRNRILAIPDPSHERPNSPAAKRTAREDNHARAFGAFETAADGFRVLAGSG